jgi:hypothetical protein
MGPRQERPTAAAPVALREVELLTTAAGGEAGSLADAVAAERRPTEGNASGRKEQRIWLWSCG